MGWYYLMDGINTLNQYMEVLCGVQSKTLWSAGAGLVFHSVALARMVDE